MRISLMMVSRRSTASSIRSPTGPVADDRAAWSDSPTGQRLAQWRASPPHSRAWPRTKGAARETFGPTPASPRGTHTDVSDRECSIAAEANQSSPMKES